MNCPACGATTGAGARFCQECGQRLGATLEERRVATVLMADLVGFTTMSAGADPEQIKRLVDHCFDQLVADITAFGGRLDKIVGDEIIAIFGAPVAHEDDAERAVRAALCMQETMERVASEIAFPVQVRIGVNSGEVLVGAMRAGGDPTAMGDVVNTAQRLEKLGEPGHVTVGPATESATRQAIRYESLGAVALRGREEPIEAFRAIEALTPPGRRRARQQSPLVGRDAELATLRGLAKMATKRERAHLIFLVGDAGVGKSRLATALGEIAARELGAYVLTAECLPYGDSNAFGPIAEALRQAAAGDGHAGKSDMLTRIREKTAEVLAPDTEDAELERVAEGLLYLLGGIARPGVDPSRAHDEALRSAVAILEGLALRAPLVLVLSDLHWASDDTLELCERLLSRLRNRPFVLIATARPDAETRWNPEPGTYNGITLQLDPLDEQATGELVRALLDDDASDDTATLLFERSGGNPFFIEELVAFMQETGETTRILEVPATLHGLLAARLDALDPAERSLLEDCAIVGASGPSAAVIELANRADAPQLLDRLAERDLIELDDDDDFHFKSDLIHEIAYGTLTKAERARRHARVAPILAARGETETDRVAHHLATAAELVGELGAVPGVPADVREQAVTALVQAADRAELAESWVSVGHHNNRALGLLAPEPGPQRWHALLGRGKAAVQQRHIDAARDDLLTVLTEAKDAGELRPQAEALTLLGGAEVAVGAYDAADETLAEALERWREIGDDAGGADVLRELGVSHLFRGDLVQAERFVSEALAAYRAAGRERGGAWALQNLAWISFSSGDVPRAESRLQQSASAFAELGDWGGLGWAYGLLAFVRYNQGRLEEAALLAEHIAIDGRETGNRWAVGMMGVLLANVRLWSGRMAESVARGQEAITLFQEIGDRWGEVMATGPVVRALAELGRDGEYADTLAHYRTISRDMPDEGMRMFPEVLESLVDLQQGRPEAAQAILETLELDDDDTGQLGFADGCAAIGLSLLQLGRVDDAINVLTRGYRDVTEDGPAMAIGSRLALAYAAARRPDDADVVLDEMGRRTGGTFSDRMLALWGESFVRTQQGAADARGAADAAYEIATATDAPLEHAIAALARAKVLAALGADDADTARTESDRQLREIGLTADGWARVFDLALADVTVPL